MSVTSRASEASKSAAPNDWTAFAKPFAKALEELTRSLENSRLGVAFFDRSFRCQALNRAFAAAWSVPAAKFLGKTLHQTVGAEAGKLKVRLAEVFSKGAVVSNVRINGEPAEVAGDVALRVANFYPLKNDRGQVRSVAMTLGDISTVEFHLANLVAKLQAALPAATSLLGASFPEVLARSLQFSTYSIRKLRLSLSHHSPLQGTQLEIDLMPLALLLSLTGSRSPFAALPEQGGYRPPALEPVPLEVPPPEPSRSSRSALEDPSPRELQVLRLLAGGRSNKEIGISLGISTRTVETYRARIIRKLGLHSTAELVRYAIRHKIVDA